MERQAIGILDIIVAPSRLLVSSHINELRTGAQARLDWTECGMTQELANRVHGLMAKTQSQSIDNLLFKASGYSNIRYLRQ